MNVRPDTQASYDAARLEALLALAHRAADAAAAITRAAFRQPLPVDDKSLGQARFDPVTEADRAAERAIRQVLADGAPDIGFIGEESSASDAASSGRVGSANDPAAPVWIVDPIDGTRAFIAGIPLWGTLIALRIAGEPVLGLLDQPALGERYVGRCIAHERSATSIHDGLESPLRTRVGVPLGRAVVCCTSPDMFTDARTKAGFRRLADAVRMVRYGTDCYGYAMLAAGHVDLVVEADLAPWDVQALVPIVRAAGGSISDWQGGPPGDGGDILAAGTPALHREALDRLRS